MTPEERADALEAKVLELMRHAGARMFGDHPPEAHFGPGDLERLDLTLDEAEGLVGTLMPAAHFPKRWVAAAVAEAASAARARAAMVVAHWKGPASRSAMVRGILLGGEPGAEGPEEPALARQLATVDLMAAVMKGRLIEHRAKGDWRASDPHFLLARLLEEAGELAAAVRSGLEGDEYRALVRKEAADVGNLALMVADGTARWTDRSEEP